MVDLKNYEKIIAELEPYHADLIAVSKKKPAEDILALLKHGQIYFGENYVQELLEKHKEVSGAVWHFIGHLQSNKVKQLESIVKLIHGIDSLNLINEVNRQAEKNNHVQDCLLQIHVSKEETKFGFSFEEAEALMDSGILKSLKNISMRGFMCMASATDDEKIIRNEFKQMNGFFEKYKNNNISILSMGMTSDYKIALEEGSTMVRIGSAIFGDRV